MVQLFLEKSCKKLSKLETLRFASRTGLRLPCRKTPSLSALQPILEANARDRLHVFVRINYLNKKQVTLSGFWQ
jgi:hypothetical protein